jgi:hypothetical protein
MSLNGLMGVGLSSPGAKNPWEAQSPPAVDFRAGLRVENGNGVLTEPAGALPEDRVTLTLVPVDAGNLAVGSAPADDSANAGAFRTVA